MAFPLMVRKIHGHSMMPALPPGTLIWALRWFNTLKVGGVVIFEHDGKEKIKRISEIKDGKLFLLGDYATASTDSRDFGWIEADAVIGKLVWPRAPKVVNY